MTEKREYQIHYVFSCGCKLPHKKVRFRWIGDKIHCPAHLDSILLNKERKCLVCHQIFMMKTHGKVSTKCPTCRTGITLTTDKLKTYRDDDMRNMELLENRKYNCTYYNKCLTTAATLNNEFLGCMKCKQYTEHAGIPSEGMLMTTPVDWNFCF